MLSSLIELISKKLLIIRRLLAYLRVSLFLYDPLMYIKKNDREAVFFNFMMVIEMSIYEHSYCWKRVKLLFLFDKRTIVCRIKK